MTLMLVVNTIWDWNVHMKTCCLHCSHTDRQLSMVILVTLLNWSSQIDLVLWTGLYTCHLLRMDVVLLCLWQCLENHELFTQVFLTLSFDNICKKSKKLLLLFVNASYIVCLTMGCSMFVILVACLFSTVFASLLCHKPCLFAWMFGTSLVNLLKAFLATAACHHNQPLLTAGTPLAPRTTATNITSSLFQMLFFLAAQF